MKHRLNTSSLYIANTKPNGFSMEVANNDPNMVIVGVRVMLGSLDTHRVPSFVEIFGRTKAIMFDMNKSRWFEFPLTREESLQADKKITITFGQSLHPGSVTNIVDNVQIYGKTKELFGWPEDQEEFPAGSAPASSPDTGSGHGSQGPLDPVLWSILEILDGCFKIVDATDHQRSAAMEQSSRLLLIPTHPRVLSSSRSLLSSLFATRSSFNNHVDQTLMKHVSDTIDEHCDKEMTIEVFQKVVLIARSVAVQRPNNLVKYVELKDQKFARQLSKWFWELAAKDERSNILTGPIGNLGFAYMEATVQSLIEIFHSFLIAPDVSVDMIGFMSKLYSEFLMAENPQVSFAAKQSLVRVLRPKTKRKPKLPEPEVAKETLESAPTVPTRDGPPSDPRRDFEEPLAEVGNRMGARLVGGVAGNLDALLPGLGGVLDLPADVDDEAMMELAIALSLQEQNIEGGEENLQQGLQGLHQGLQQLANLGPNLEGYPGLQGLAGMLGGAIFPPEEPVQPDEPPAPENNQSEPEPEPQEQIVQGNDPSHYSDTTASAPASDDEDQPKETNKEVDEPKADDEMENAALQTLKLALLEQLLTYLPNLRSVGGVRSIPTMQVILMLSSDLDGNSEKHKEVLDNLLTVTINELELTGSVDRSWERSDVREFQLVILRLFSVLMSRSKSGQGQKQEQESSFVSRSTAASLRRVGITDHCLTVLRDLLDFWKPRDDDQGCKVASSVLRCQPRVAPPDMSPFFLKQYVRTHASDVFESYPQLLTEMALRLPYQSRKIEEASSFKKDWSDVLCEYMMVHQTPYVRRQARKLLLSICGSRDKYRELRDIHTLRTQIGYIKAIVSDGNGENFPYDTLLTLIEHLRTCVEISTTRTSNWQKFCRDNDTILGFLFKISLMMDDGVSPIVLQLLQGAICQTGQELAKSKSASPFKSEEKGPEPRRTRSEEPTSGSLYKVLVEQINRQVDGQLMSKFVERFLLECNSTSVRWQAHALLVTIVKNSSGRQQKVILDTMWSLWKHLSKYGRKASQFVDLLGFFSMKRLKSEEEIQPCVQDAVGMLYSQNVILANHPNAGLYGSLAQLVQLNGF